MDSISKYTQQNRRVWDEIAAVRHRAEFPPAGFFARGGTVLDERVLQAAGDIKGKSVLHLQCSTGSETLSWAVAGALATGVDISEAQIAIALQTAQEAGLPVRFLAADVYDLLPGLQSEFDIVYTGGGALVWLPELEGWAAVVAASLRPGGSFLLYEEHPLAGCLWLEDGVLRVVSDYFSRSQPEVVQGWSHFKGGEGAQEPKYEFTWPLGDVITALAEAGLVIRRLQEYPTRAEWRLEQLGSQVARLPGEYLLIARKL